MTTASPSSSPSPARRPLARVLRWVVPLVLLGGIAAAAVSWTRARAARAALEPLYKATPVEARDVVGRVTASGALSALVTVQVGTQVSGRIKELNVDYNSPVKKGQLIAKLDPQLFAATVEQTQANYLSAQAQLRRSEAEAQRADKALARAKELRAGGLSSEAELETAEATASSARAQVDVSKAATEQARASLNQAKVNLSFTEIHSPIDGVVISKSVDVGQTVAASLQAPVLFTIAEDLKKMQVDTNVSEGDVGRLEPGMTATFRVDAFPERVFRGKVGTIRNAPTTVQNVVTYDAVIQVDNSDLKLKPGMTATVTITYAERRGALAVPNAALRFRPEGAVPEAKKRERPDERTLYRVTGPRTVEPVPVRIGLSDGSYTEIVEGLEAGAEIAVELLKAPSAPAAPAGGSPLGGAAGGGGRRGPM